jgi:hypothetical protein
VSGDNTQGGKRPAGAVQPTLFDPLPALRLGQQTLGCAASNHKLDIERLVPLARELAMKAGTAGVTVADLRLYAEQRGLLTGQERGRVLSYLGAVMKAAGLLNTRERRRSHIVRTHGNLQTIWRAPSVAETPG